MATRPPFTWPARPNSRQPSAGRLRGPGPRDKRSSRTSWPVQPRSPEKGFTDARGRALPLGERGQLGAKGRDRLFLSDTTSGPLLYAQAENGESDTRMPPGRIRLPRSLHGAGQLTEWASHSPRGYRAQRTTRSLRSSQRHRDLTFRGPSGLSNATGRKFPQLGSRARGLCWHRLCAPHHVPCTRQSAGVPATCAKG